VNPYRLDSEPELLEKVRHVIQALIDRNVAWLKARMLEIPGNVVTPEHLFWELEQYGKTYLPIPETDLKAVEIWTSGDGMLFAVIDLYSLEEGWTDLTLELEFHRINGQLEPRVKYVHIL
jgi:hypothetical protein